MLNKEFWLSTDNIKNSFIHMIIGSLIFVVTISSSHIYSIFPYINVFGYALCIEIVQRLYRDTNKFADSIRDILTYMIIPFIYWMVK